MLKKRYLKEQRINDQILQNLLFSIQKMSQRILSQVSPLALKPLNSDISNSISCGGPLQKKTSFNNDFRERTSVSTSFQTNENIMSMGTLASKSQSQIQWQDNNMGQNIFMRPLCQQTAENSNCRLENIVSDEYYTKIQNYEVKDLLGSGAFGDVYRATFMPLGLELAMKIINLGKYDEQYREFIQQCISNQYQVCNRLKDTPNLVYLPKTYAVFQQSNQVYIVTQLFYGFTLQKLIQSEKIQLTPQDKKFYLFSLISALKQLHQQLSTIHRDIKPQNIMILADGNLKLIDFGCAKELPPKVKTSSIIGTYQYYSPERFSKEYGKEADIWAFAVIAFELSFKKLPFTFEGIDDCLEEEKLSRLAKIIKKRKNFKIEEEDYIDPYLKELIEAIYNSSRKEREQKWTIGNILSSQYFACYQGESLSQPYRNFSVVEVQEINGRQKNGRGL